jgi:hypothetical protein
MTKNRDAPYWQHSDPEPPRSSAAPCARGCVQARKHITDCTEKDCKGCLPRGAEFGGLCYGCHSRLLNMLHTAPAQHALLEAVVAPSFAQDYAQPTMARVPGPRVDSSGAYYMALAKRTGASEGSEPLRLACIDTATALTDILSEWVEMLAEQHAMSGPIRLATGSGTAWGHWRVSRWPLAVDEAPEWVWSDPPALFAIGSACKWLLAQVALLESCPGIKSLWAELAETMSQAHALAPWREQAATLKGIECPECHRSTLRLFGGDEDVTCTTCHATIGWDRYAIWVRELQQRRMETA